MTVIGTVRNGKIELPEGVSLPEGTDVAVEVIEAKPKALPTEKLVVDSTRTNGISPSEAEPIDGYALNRALMKFAGIFKGYPEDSSVNLDHYLYGVPKNP